MDNARHTPGPWKLDGWMVCANDSEESFICEVYSWAVNPRHEAEARRNACLIAVAPELLEALQELCNKLGPRWFLEQNWAAPLAVLAKALGEPSHG